MFMKEKVKHTSATIYLARGLSFGLNRPLLPCFDLQGVKAPRILSKSSGLPKPSLLAKVINTKNLCTNPVCFQIIG